MRWLNVLPNVRNAKVLSRMCGDECTRSNVLRGAFGARIKAGKS
jgi:hypothetical protein